jgi:predicted extracellular nuclease
MTRTVRVTLSMVCLLLLGSGLAACGGDETSTETQTSEPTPAICQDVEALQESVGDLQDIEIDEGALSQLGTQLDTIRGDVGQIRRDAGDENATEIEAVSTSADSLESSIDAAVASPSATTLTAVGDNVRALASAVRNLGDALEDTC